MDLLERNSPLPLHAQFEEIIRKKITEGEWPVDTAIPSENELSAMYGISRMTVRGVLNRLAADGLLYRVPGKGTYVSEPKIVSRPLSQMGIREQLERMGYETTTQLLGVEKQGAPGWAAGVLKLPAGTTVYVVRRLRFVKGAPFSIHTSWVPEALCPGLEAQDLVGMQLCDIEEKAYGLNIVRRVETLESVKATPTEAELLAVRRNEPLLLFENLVYTSGDRPIECARVLFRADKIKLRMEYTL